MIGLVVTAILLVAGLAWCKEVIGRLPKDLAELSGEADATTKGVIVLIWVLTLIIAAAIFWFLYGLMMPILDRL